MNKAQQSKFLTDADMIYRLAQADPRMYDNVPEYVARQAELRAEITGGIGQDYDYGRMSGRGANGHGTDAGKLPWHPTFSTESAFVTEQTPGGQWGGDGNVTTFRPTPRQDTEYFRQYMREVEPDVRIVK